jgi:hypothetical protein
MDLLEQKNKSDQTPPQTSSTQINDKCEVVGASSDQVVSCHTIHSELVSGEDTTCMTEDDIKNSRSESSDSTDDFLYFS